MQIMATGGTGGTPGTETTITTNFAHVWPIGRTIQLIANTERSLSKLYFHFQNLSLLAMYGGIQLSAIPPRSLDPLHIEHIDGSTLFTSIFMLSTGHPLHLPISEVFERGVTRQRAGQPLYLSTFHTRSTVAMNSTATATASYIQYIFWHDSPEGVTTINLR